MSRNAHLLGRRSCEPAPDLAGDAQAVSPCRGHPGREAGPAMGVPGAGSCGVSGIVVSWRWASVRSWL